jgi:hypothetical protein
LKVQLDVHVFIFILYSSLFLALHVSGAACTHPQEHKLQCTAIGVCNLWKAEFITVLSGVELYILHELVGMCVLSIQSYDILD